MPTAKKLPSGSWRVRAAYTVKEQQEDGTYKSVTKTKSFTSKTTGRAGKREAEAAAATWLAGRKVSDKKKDEKTFGECMDLYIRSREKTLSPGTIREYRMERKLYYSSIDGMNIFDIEQEDVQDLVNEYAGTLQPKTIRNIHGLLSSVMAEYRPDFVLRTNLPKKIKPNMYMPTEEDVRAIIRACKGTDMELPILLAIFGPMRRGEICALRSENISGNTVHVCQSMVMDQEKKWVIKSPKSYAGDRYITFPEEVSKLWEGKEGYVVDIRNPNLLGNKFRRMLRKNGIPHMRFHSLRHFSASMLHAIGIPDAYLCERGGWEESGNTLREVYRHSMSDQKRIQAEKANSYFSSLLEK